MLDSILPIDGRAHASHRDLAPIGAVLRAARRVIQSSSGWSNVKARTVLLVEIILQLASFHVPTRLEMSYDGADPSLRRGLLHLASGQRKMMEST